MGRKSNAKERQKKILHFMRTEITNKGYPPTVREICDALHIKSTSTVHKDLTDLESQNLLRRDPSKPRAIVLADQPYQNEIDTHENKTYSYESNNVINLHKDGGYTNSTDADTISQNLTEVRKKYHDQKTDLHKIRNDIVDIPLIGRVAAGQPILAEENIDSYFPIPAQYVAGECFMLRVSGESMINLGIMDGDLILVSKSATAHNGDTVVAMINNGFEPEATVKTFYKEDGHIRLQPENDFMDPIIVDNVNIQGIVKGVFRYFG